jgi:hypothetical protein
MPIFDFDREAQLFFEKIPLEKHNFDWKEWVQFTSTEEYKNFVLYNSNLDSIDDLWNKLKYIETDSTELSVDPQELIDNYSNYFPLILCHSSGTTNSDLTALKWFHMSSDIITRYWAPGMNAIFESSGLSSKNSALIFVPSRLKLDGMKTSNEKRYCSLYSSEFSQRIMLTSIKPESYLLNEYKNSKHLAIISQILSMENIAVISAPAITILGWANPEKLKEGIRKSLATVQDFPLTQTLEYLLKLVEEEGLNTATSIIQSKLSEKLQKATIVFSISSLSKSNWALIRKFMNWEDGKEKFTNLYVASEIGPIASSLGDYKLSRSNLMYIFPLFLPMLKYRNKIEFITNSSFKTGKLLISKTENGKPLLNVNIGDVISVESQEILPLIHGKILRSSFKLKYPIKLNDSIKTPENYSVHAGDYFECKSFDLIEPRNLIYCLNEKLKSNIDSMVFLISSNEEDSQKRFIIPVDCEQFKEDIFFECLSSNSLIREIKSNKVSIKLDSNKIVQYLEDREEVLEKVRKGTLAKGILKKWPLYVILPQK